MLVCLSFVMYLFRSCVRYVCIMCVIDLLMYVFSPVVCLSFVFFCVYVFRYCVRSVFLYASMYFVSDLCVPFFSYLFMCLVRSLFL